MRLDRFIFAGIILLLIFTPMAFGSVHVWAYTLMELSVFLLFLLFWINRLVILKSSDLEWIKTSINKILILFLVFIGIQIIPLPPAVLSVISPKTWEDKLQAQTVLAKASGIENESGGWMAISYVIHPTIREWLKAASYIVMFFLTLYAVHSKRRINILIYILIFSGVFQTIYAIYQVFSDHPKIWWWASRVGKAKFASGTFIVSNHFAFYLEMMFPLAFGYMIAQKKRTRRFLPGGGGFRAAIQKIIAWFSPESYQPKYIFFFFLAVIIGLGLLLSASRGGILSMSASMLIMSFLFLTKKQFRRYGAITLLLCFLSFGYGLHVGLDPTLNKFERVEGLYHRLNATKTLFPILRDYPAAGVGWGNLSNIYPRYIQSDSPEASIGAFAGGYSHNDWIEAFTEVGWIGGLILVSAFGLFWIRLVKVWRQRNDYHAVGIGAGVLTGLLSIGFHSYFDFSMHIPANPLTLAAVLAVGYAAVHRKGHGYAESFFYRIRKISLSRTRRALGASAVLIITSAAMFLIVRHFLAELKCPTEWNSTLNLNWNPYLTDIEKAISYNPLNDDYHFKRGNFFDRRKHQIYDKNGFKEFNEKAIISYEKSVMLNPLKGVYWSYLARQYEKKDYELDRYVDHWLRLADECNDIALKNEPCHIGILSSAAVYWVWRSQVLPKFDGTASNQPGKMTQQDGIQKFQELFQRILTLKPAQWKWAAATVWGYYPDDAVVMGIAPKGDEKLASSLLEWIVSKKSQ